MVVDALDADVMGDEPIWAKVNGRDFGTIEKPHGHGPKRYDAGGNVATGSAAGDRRLGHHRQHATASGRVVGWVTSGGYAHYVKKSMAQGYLPAELADDTSNGMFEIEILGKRRPARINLEPLFDPAGERMRA